MVDVRGGGSEGGRVFGRKSENEMEREWESGGRSYRGREVCLR